MEEFKERGKTIFFVSHSNGQMKKFCNKAIWLEHGTIREYGAMKDIMPKYEAFIKEYKSWSKEEKRRFKEEGMKKQEGLLAADSEEKGKRKKSRLLFR